MTDLKYPRVAIKMTKLNPNYPLELKLKMEVAVSVLMANLDSSGKLANNMIDLFGCSYLQNYSKLADTLFETLGDYNKFPQMELLDPDTFIKKLIS
jgi:hypothetical protein